MHPERADGAQSGLIRAARLGHQARDAGALRRERAGDRAQLFGEPQIVGKSIPAILFKALEFNIGSLLECERALAGK
jgi:hypothetical protein